MRALVLGGAGAVCTETTRDLATYSTFEEVVVADYNLASVERLITEIDSPRLKPLQFNADDTNAMRELFPQFDIVVNGLPFKYDLVVNQVCVETGVNGLDLSSDDEQFALHDEAARKGMTFIPGMGATPGTTNVFAAKGVAQLDEVESIQIYFAAFRCLAPAPGLLTTTIWEFDPDEPARQEAYFQDGEWVPAPPLSGEKAVQFHDEIGEQPVYFVPHDESYTLPESYPALKHASVRGCFPPHVMNMMRLLKEAGALSQESLNALEGRAPVDLVRELFLALPWSKWNPVWGYGLVVKVEGVKDGKQTCVTLRNDHPPHAEWGDHRAYYKNVGIPLAIGAQMIADGRVTARGVVPPEQAIPVEPYLEELARRGMTYTMQVDVTR